MLYLASDFATCVIEVLVRDRFVQRETRIIPYDDVRARAWIEVNPPHIDPLVLVDLRGTGCLTLGAPTDAAHARNQVAGRALARALYTDYPETDGICYPSRLTGGDCFAIFDRAVNRLTMAGGGDLALHPKLPDVLENYGISLSL